LHLCRSTYYQYQHQTKPEQFKRRQVLYQQIRRIYFDHRRVYGAPKVHEELLREGYHASFKKEEVYQRTYKDYHEANLAQFSYIEGFYNSRRIISADGYLTPDEKEQLVS
jgi:transposase InsO family protein